MNKVLFYYIIIIIIIIIIENQELAASFKDRRRTENIRGWKEKPLYGQFARRSEDQRRDETWTWLKEREL